MSTSITIRLTPSRERLLKSFKKRHNISSNTQAIELALKMVSEEEIDYLAKINKVKGCIVGKSRKNAIDQIRELRGE
jgi:hypothetical protein